MTAINPDLSIPSERAKSVCVILGNCTTIDAEKPSCVDQSARSCRLIWVVADKGFQIGFFRDVASVIRYCIALPRVFRRAIG